MSSKPGKEPFNLTYGKNESTIVISSNLITCALLKRKDRIVFCRKRQLVRDEMSSFNGTLKIIESLGSKEEFIRAIDGVSVNKRFLGGYASVRNGVLGITAGIGANDLKLWTGAGATKLCLDIYIRIPEDAQPDYLIEVSLILEQLPDRLPRTESPGLPACQ